LRRQANTRWSRPEVVSAICWSLMPLGGVLGGVLVMAPAFLPSFRGMNRPVAVRETVTV
jgi:hypothetical protein